MRIGIDARLYGPEDQGGIGRYLEQLIQNLVLLDQKNEYIIFLRQDYFSKVDFKNVNFKKVLADFHWYTLSEQLFLPYLIWQEKIDLIHFPHFNIPIFCPTKFVVTIHDLILLNFPSARATTLGPLKYKFKKLGYKLVIKTALRRAKKIITVSNFTKDEIIKKFKIEAKKIEVINEGVTQKIYFNESGDKNILFRYNINKPYLLYVGNAYPHKNLEGLIQVFKKISQKFDWQLVMVGAGNYFYRRLEEEAKKFGFLSVDNKIIFTGRVSERDLVSLYKEALLSVFPSFYEGFGLPPLEAMSYDLPVAASGSASLPEILGEAALYFDPKNLKEMEEIIIKIATNSGWREELKRKGREQIKKYSWQKCAEETLRVYQGIKFF